jgi:hypothetical protein
VFNVRRNLKEYEDAYAKWRQDAVWPLTFRDLRSLSASVIEPSNQLGFGSSWIVHARCIGFFHVEKAQKVSLNGLALGSLAARCANCRARSDLDPTLARYQFSTCINPPNTTRNMVEVLKMMG